MLGWQVPLSCNRVRISRVEYFHFLSVSDWNILFQTNGFEPISMHCIDWRYFKWLALLILNTLRTQVASQHFCCFLIVLEILCGRQWVQNFRLHFLCCKWSLNFLDMFHRIPRFTHCYPRQDRVVNFCWGHCIPEAVGTIHCTQSAFLRFLRLKLRAFLSN